MGRRPSKAPRLDVVASISRSSGTEAGGDALRDFQFQEDYAQTLASKVESHWTQFHVPHDEHAIIGSSKEELLECDTLLIAFRKLREGILASHRTDAFAVHVYEASFLLAVLFASPTHATAAQTHLLQALYPVRPRTGIVPIAAMLHVLAHHPHPSEFVKRLRQCAAFLEPDEYAWLSKLASYKRTGNFAAAQQHLSTARLVASLNGDIAGDLYGGRMDIGQRAVRWLLQQIQGDIRQSTWNVLRCAYREAIVQDSASWLARTLALSPDGELHKWIEDRARKGEVRDAELNGRLRWTFVKAKV